jgi:hypothetical protein
MHTAAAAFPPDWAYSLAVWLRHQNEFVLVPLLFALIFANCVLWELPHFWRGERTEKYGGIVPLARRSKGLVMSASVVLYAGIMVLAVVLAIAMVDSSEFLFEFRRQHNFGKMQNPWGPYPDGGQLAEFGKFVCMAAVWGLGVVAARGVVLAGAATVGMMRGRDAQGKRLGG